jgi:4-hydroxy-tetrahydrodipicolinate synthase
VQAADAEKAARYARHAEKCGAGALIALPPPGRSDPKEVIAYYQEIGKAAPLPLIVQAVGAMSVDMIAEMARTVPTLAAVKDEAGNPLERIGELQAKAGRLKFFTGNHGRTLIDELLRGFAGTMPAAGFADLYVEAWNLWQGGKRREAVDAFGRAAVLIQEVNVYGTESLKYVLYRRGVFKNWRTREKGQEGKLNEAGRKSLDQILDLMKPYLKA